MLSRGFLFIDNIALLIYTKIVNIRSSVKKLNLIGEKFGRLTVLREDPDKQYAYWCQCDCGKIKSIYAKSLRSGSSKSCGCLQKELLNDRSIDADSRFWSKVNKNGPIPEYRSELGSCWIWTAAQDGRGYGAFHFGDRNSVIKAYRYSYQTQVGRIPTNMQLDHKCRVTLCVNPDHLELVTQKENIQRGVMDRRKGMCVKGLHEMLGKNVYVNPKTGKTRCVACRDEYRHRYYAEKRDNRPQK